MQLTTAALTFVKVILSLAILWFAGMGICEVNGFDTYWHFEATEPALQKRQFSVHARDLVRLGNFGPDFFVGHDVIVKRMEELYTEKKLALIPGVTRLMRWNHESKEASVMAPKLAVFMHFDDLFDELDTSWKFEYLFRRLLANTRRILTGLYDDNRMNQETRKILILMVIGSSLHMVQDFYCHTTWIHLDFSELRLLPASAKNVPTWNDICRQLQMAANGYSLFPFKLEAGTFPPPDARHILYTVDGFPKTHTAINHDNTKLLSEGFFQVKYHSSGFIPAGISARGHMQLAVDAASRGSLEWIDRVAEDAKAAAVINTAKSWVKPRLLLADDARNAVIAARRISCLIEHYDGASPMTELHSEIDRLLNTKPAELTKILLGREEYLPNPYNRFWSSYITHRILERLTEGLGNPETGHYLFPKQ